MTGETARLSGSTPRSVPAPRVRRGGTATLATPLKVRTHRSERTTRNFFTTPMIDKRRNNITPSRPEGPSRSKSHLLAWLFVCVFAAACAALAVWQDMTSNELKRHLMESAASRARDSTTIARLDALGARATHLETKLKATQSELAGWKTSAKTPAPGRIVRPRRVEPARRAPVPELQADDEPDERRGQGTIVLVLH
ncbi:MAG TPA: hypothetical protein VF169_11110 [Albitalea sp.]|uniref:hypothetical protein n=1 Tax=Piscinibacter sp. TaxID=1903157 RepID=UPI002ED56BDB